MFGLDDHLELARAWGDIAFACMTAAVQVSTAMLAPFARSTTVFSPAAGSSEPQPSSTRVHGWSSGPIESRPVSWYREPRHSPFESWLGLAWVMPPAAPNPTLVPQQVPGMLQPWQAWMQLLGSSTLPASTALPVNWMGWPHAAGWPMTTLPWVAGTGYPTIAPLSGRSTATDGAQFAAYRSDSGHAVAQITFPNDVVAAVAVPPSTATLLDAFFPWSRLYH